MSDWRKIRPARNKGYLESFPEEIYDLSETSHIVRLLDALCGDSGVGYARKSLLIKRLQTSLSETRFNDLDMVYSYMFGLPRLKAEQYSHSTSSLLTWEEQQEVQVKDSKYRARINKYMQSFQYGGTKKGIQLASEASIGYPCQVIECREYYAARGIENGSEVTVELGDHMIADYNEYVVVIMRDEPLTQEEYRQLYTVTKRIRPVDAKITFKTSREISDEVVLTDLEDVFYDVEPTEESSHWWNVTKYVTGRPDWDYSKYPSLWVEPNVKKEAPRQLLVNSQEESEDFTFMVSSVLASSEHVGLYNRMQQEYFESLSEATELMQGKYSLSSASSRKYTASFYGGDAVIGWSYPVEYSEELQRYFTESGRSIRFWSSDEMEEGTEWLEFELKRTLPINRIQLNISRKPMRVTPYASSALDAEGNRIWVRIEDGDGLNLSYRQLTWGGASIAGEMVTVDFSFATIRADAIRLEFERLDIPYRKQLSANAYDEIRFPYSIEASNISFGYDIKAKSDYIDATYEDPFGNRVETVMRDMPIANAFDNNENTYWVSQPNIGEDAVEYLIIKVGDGAEGKRINFLDISSIYDGCQVNIYSTEDEKPGIWRPYPQVMTLGSGRIELPTRRVTYLKLEFTNLCAIPYRVASSGIEVESRLYPHEVTRHIDDIESATRELSYMQRLLTSADDASYEVNNVYTELGIGDIYQEIEMQRGKVADESWGESGVMPFSASDFRAAYGTSASISNIYGENFNEEVSLEQSRAKTVALPESRVRYRFYEEGEHKYDLKRFERIHDIAYVVGIREIKVGLTAHTLAIDSDSTFMLPLTDGRFLEDVDGWRLDNEERLSPDNENEICSFETVDLETMVPFRTFEFAVNEKPPREMFEHPSNMLKEWNGINADIYSDEFGVSGTVLGAELSKTSDSGIKSENKLVRSKSIANVEVDVFPLEDSEWVFECVDAYGENIFAMHYNLKKGKWTTIGTVFNPMPGGGWWSMDYAYRVNIPVVGPMAEGNCIFVPSIDFDALRDAGITTSDFKDLRLLYFDGIDNYELDCDVTDNMELWFRCCQTLVAGEAADGKYHFDTKKFHGAYYVYFGNKYETKLPKRDYSKVFSEHDLDRNTGAGGTSGTTFSGRGQYVEIDEGYRLSNEDGFITMEYTPTTTPAMVPSGAVGKAEVRFLLDYEDEDKAVQVYTYERQLTFVIVENDGFENAFVSEKYDFLVGGTTKRMMITWGKRGSKQIYENGSLSDGELRRDIHVYVGSDGIYEELACIDNVYDEKRYNAGRY